MQSLKELLKLRETIIRQVREYFYAQSFIEVETPLVVSAPDPEPSIEPFQTVWHPNYQEAHPAYLITSPEFFMKRLLCNGSGNIFQIVKCFRDCEPVSLQHNPEFTMIEWYRENADYTDIMKDCEELFLKLLQKVKQEKSTTLVYQSKEYDLSLPWERLSVIEAFEKYCGISSSTLLDWQAFIAEVKGRGYQVEGFTYDDIFHQVLLNEVEPHLGEYRPTFLYDYPASQAALAKRKASDPRLAERFELYIGGLELGNAFSELADASEQQSRFEKQLQDRTSNNQSTWQVDIKLISDLEKGLPPTGGIALGIDRVIMLFADAASISEVLPYSATEIFHGISAD